MKKGRSDKECGRAFKKKNNELNKVAKRWIISGRYDMLNKMEKERGHLG